MNFTLPIHLATDKNCSIRPIFQYVYFENGYMYATDANVGIRAKIAPFFDGDGDLKFLEKKGISNVKFALIYKQKRITITEQGFETADGILYKFDNIDKYPNLNKLIDESVSAKKGPVEKIGIDLSLANKLSKAMTQFKEGIKQFKLEFISPSKAILVTKIGQDDCVGIVMPVMIDL